MTDFQKSLTRFLYVGLIVAAMISVVAIVKPGPRHGKLNAMQRYGEYGRYGSGVTATGTCVVRTKPDLAEVTIGVQQSTPSARRTTNYVKSVMRKVSQALTSRGVASKDIQTENFQLQSVWDSGRNWQVKKWNGGETLRVRIRDVDKAADLIDAAVKAGANRIGQLEFTVDDVNKLRSQGRARAAKVARRKAEQLATSLGGSLGKLVQCNESYPDSERGYYYGNWNFMDGHSRYAKVHSQASYNAPEAPDAEREEVTIQPGQMTMTVVVTATYELE